ncbi:hypothetical protein FAIPA1_80084 [Frankia sp. AiPs1]
MTPPGVPPDWQVRGGPPGQVDGSEVEDALPRPAFSTVSSDRRARPSPSPSGQCLPWSATGPRPTRPAHPACARPAARLGACGAPDHTEPLRLRRPRPRDAMTGARPSLLTVSKRQSMRYLLQRIRPATVATAPAVL